MLYYGVIRVPYVIIIRPGSFGVQNKSYSTESKNFAMGMKIAHWLIMEAFLGTIKLMTSVQERSIRDIWRSITDVVEVSVFQILTHINISLSLLQDLDDNQDFLCCLCEENYYPDIYASFVTFLYYIVIY